MLNHYSIYWIKEEFAHHFFHNSEVLYRFIKEYQMNKNREDLERQYEYITLDFPKSSLISHITNNHPNNSNMKVEGNRLKIYKDIQYISLHIQKKKINFRSEMIHDAEELLFPALRLFQPYLFIVGNDLRNYGWISPVIQGKKNKTGQVLYSYL